MGSRFSSMTVRRQFSQSFLWGGAGVCVCVWRQSSPRLSSDRQPHCVHSHIASHGRLCEPCMVKVTHDAFAHTMMNSLARHNMMGPSFTNVTEAREPTSCVSETLCGRQQGATSTTNCVSGPPPFLVTDTTRQLARCERPRPIQGPCGTGSAGPCDGQILRTRRQRSSSSASEADQHRRLR